MNLIRRIEWVALVTCLAILSICQVTSAMAQSFEESLEHARATARASVDDQFSRWQDWQGLENVAQALANHGGDQAISHIEQLVDKHGARVVTHDRLLGVTLAKCAGKPSGLDLVRRITADNSVKAMRAMMLVSFMPRERARDLTEDTLFDPPLRGSKSRFQERLRMLAIIGDEESARILEEYIAAHDTVPALVEATYARLRMNLSREKEHPETDWKENGLILWRASRDSPVAQRTLDKPSCCSLRLEKNGIRVPFDFLRYAWEDYLDGSARTVPAMFDDRSQAIIAMVMANVQESRRSSHFWRRSFSARS